MRVRREEFSIEKRGSKGIRVGRQLGYLQALELSSHSCVIKKKYKEPKATHWSQKSMITLLKISRPSLQTIVEEMLDRKDEFSFYGIILKAHHINAFGGKPTCRTS